MKRVLALLSLVCALFLASACHYDVNLSVEASAELTYSLKGIVRIDPAIFEGFHHNNLTDNELEEIFVSLTKDCDLDFQTAFLHLRIYDEIGGKFLREENYGVVFNGRHYDFAEFL